MAQAKTAPGPRSGTAPFDPQRGRIGAALRARDLISQQDLERATAAADEAGTTLVEAIERSRLLPSEVLLDLLGEIHSVPTLDLETTFGDPLVLDTIPREEALEYLVLPLFAVDRQLTVALPDPDNLTKLDALRFLTGQEILPCLALPAALRTRVAECYGDPAESGDSTLMFEDPPEDPEGDGNSYSLDGGEAGQPVVRLLNLIFMRAIEEGASDIHVEPHESRIVIRCRVDGRLQIKPYNIPSTIGPALSSRIKILARLDITEHRVPQDGKINVRYAGRKIDIRVSTFPTIRGEKSVLRLLDKEKQDFRLDTIGMSDRILGEWREVLHRREGILLVTGPTGSGKSSTLYATLRTLHEPEVNIVTLEDPVEYEMDGLTQGQVHDAAGFTFAKGLRSILRQDPDIILVGEIRDRETAAIAVQAAMTGHLVLATLHTNDAPGTVTRLVDIGLAPYLVSAALIGVVAQRLLRRVCPACVRAVDPTPEERVYLGAWIDAGVPFVSGAGCPECLGRGFRGRTGIHELLTVTPELRALISRGATAGELSEAARAGRFRSMWADGLEKVVAGATTLRELARVVGRDFATLPGPDASQRTA